MAVNALHRAVWWPERSPAGWTWLRSNPARVETRAPSGWVVEDSQGRPAGFMGNLVQRYWLGGRVLHGATAFSIIAMPEVHGAAHAMLDAFRDQPLMFAVWVFNANSRSQPIFQLHDMPPWPPETHGLKLGWIVDPIVTGLGWALRKAARAAPWIVGWLGEPLSNSRIGRVPDIPLPSGVERLTDLGDASPYAAYWEALSAEGRLIADRSPEMQRWRLADPDLPREPLMLAYRRDGAITGHAAAMMVKINPLDPPVLEVLDLEALDGDDQAIPALMTALRALARPMGAAKLRIQFVSPRLIQRLGIHAEQARAEGGWGHAHAAFAPDAPNQSLWSPTPYDGDYAFCLRPAP